MKKNKLIIALSIAAFFMVAMPMFSLAGTISRDPYGSATPGFYNYSSGVVGSYLFALPTLTENETIKTCETISRTIPLADFYIDGTGVIGNDETTAPGLAELDNIPAIVWATTEQSATYAIQYTFQLPSDFSDNLQIRFLASESSETRHSSINVDIWQNTDATVFDTAVDHNGCSFLTTDASTKNEVLTQDIHTTSVSAGDWLTIGLYPISGSGNLELKGIELLYTPK